MNKYAVCYTWRSLFIKVKIPDSNSGDKYWPKKNYWGVKPAASHVSQFTGNDKLPGSVVKSFPLCHLVSVFRVVSLHWKPKPNTVARFSCECLSGTFQHWSWKQDRSISAKLRGRKEQRHPNLTRLPQLLPSFFQSWTTSGSVPPLREIVSHYITVSKGSGWACRKPLLLPLWVV